MRASEHISGQFETVDIHMTSWMDRHGTDLLRISVGVVFFWFGVLKFFPGMSPAATLAAKTMHILTFGMVSDHVALFVLATWECLIGIGLIFGLALRVTLFLLWAQMLGTLTPLIFFPHACFTRIPYAPTLEGQYIIKNLVLISAGIVIGAGVRKPRRGKK